MERGVVLIEMTISEVVFHRLVMAMTFARGRVRPYLDPPK